MKKILSVLYYLFAGTFLLFPLDTQAASFDCAKAASPTEKKICADVNLSKADTDLMNAYKQAIAATPDRNALKEEQKAWLKTRDACPDAACLQKAYQERISALQKIVSAHPIPKGNSFTVQNASPHYDLSIQSKPCSGEDCKSPAQVSLFKKGASTPFQVIHMLSIGFDANPKTYDPALNKEERVLYGEDPDIVFEDFNFDGEEDLAICNGFEGSYGGPSYNVYLFDKESKKFVENKKLTELASHYLGLFRVDRKNKVIIADDKSGCCYHVTEKYQMANNRPVLVEKIIEDAMGGGDTELVTTKKLVNGSWVKKVRREKIKEE